MKIGFEAKRFFHNKTGLGNYSRDLVRILVQNFRNNSYVLYNPKPVSTRFEILNETNVEEVNPTTFFYKKNRNIWRQKGIIKDLVNDSIEIYHGLSGELPIGLKENKIKSVVTIHDLIFIRYPNLYSFFDRKIHYYKFKKAVEQADLILAISEQTKKDVIEFLNVSEDKIRVVYQGCHSAFKKGYSIEEKSRVAKKFQLPKQFILNVGSIEERKNAFTIVKSIVNSDKHLVLIGKETSYSKNIREFVEKNKMENRVHFLKNVAMEELAIIYQLSTVFVYPSIFEGFGIPIIEALFSQTPVITNKNGVFPEAAGSSSLYINPFDIEELNEKIDLMYTNSELRNTIIKEGFSFVQKFNDEVIANNIMNCYLEVLSK